MTMEEVVKPQCLRSKCVMGILHLVVLFSLSSLVIAEEAKINFVFFIGDDISQEDFGCYGHPVVETPNIDWLSANGMRFDNAYLTASSCSPSRASIITGRYPHNTGAPDLHSVMPKGQLPFPKLLREQGYYTGISGKTHMYWATKVAFEESSRGGGPGKEKDWAQRVKDRPKDRPFFFWFASIDAHRTWQKTDEVRTYTPEEVVVPPYFVDNKATREDLASYYHEITRLDHYIGLVIEELKNQGVLENTMIIVASDNGRPFPRGKSTVFDAGIKAPWIVHFPKVIKKPSVSKSFISSIDLSATCLELAGIPKPESIQGQSFLPILKDPNARIRDVVFAEQNWHQYTTHLRMVRVGDFVYIKNSFPDLPILSDSSDTLYPTGQEIFKAYAAGDKKIQALHFIDPPSPSEFLYHVGKDPDQLNNLAQNPEYGEVLGKCRRLLAAWTELTGDSVPENPTPNRQPPPRIENGKVIPLGEQTGRKNPHKEMAGAAKNATQINHPGPVLMK